MDRDLVRENAQNFWALYSGKRAVLGEALTLHDPHDQYAWCQEWRFAIADFLYWQGESVPGFRPAPNGPDTTSYAYQELWNTSADKEACWYAFNILSRYREWLRIAGRDY